MYTRLKGFFVAGVWLVLIGLALPCQAADADSVAPTPSNKLLNVSFDASAVVFTTTQPIKGEYAVYDSVDPLRVVIDFSGMQIDDAISATQPENHPVLLSVRASSFELSSGQMGRVELLLKKTASYEVKPFDNGLRLEFTTNDGENAPVDVDADAEAISSVSQSQIQVADGLSPASVVGAVQVSEQRVVLVADGEIQKYRHFTLKNPSRLVVDIYQVQPAFSERSIALSHGFSKMRVGVYKDKLRFVLDGAEAALPDAKVEKQGNALQVVWGKGEDTAKDLVSSSVPAPVDSNSQEPVEIEAVDFKCEDGQSVLSVELSGPAKIYQPEEHGGIVRFGIGNALIKRSLRRSIDASAFPSAVRLVTPYTTRRYKTQDVWFAVEFKGTVSYSLRQEGTRLLFVVDDGIYAEPAPQAVEKKVIPVPEARAAVPKIKVTDSVTEFDGPPAAPSTLAPVPSASGGAQGDVPKYTGEKVTLVFDDANIRNILQLIAEVSNLNIIAGDDVKGTITLRLVEVPWDQALDLIMDIKNLGMLREGNVVRVMPREKIREMQEERFKAARTKEELEDLVTDTFTVSYTDVATVAEQVSKRKTDRGKIIEDARNKRIIVTDIPSVVAEIKNLVALLDLPVRQVLIEARIVEASATFARDLGVKWGFSYANDPSVDGNNGSIGLGGSYLLTPPSAGTVASAAGLASGLTFGRVGLDKAVLDLRISALENSGQGRIISTPRVTTLNGEEAEISQGTEIPYQSLGSDGQAKTEFKKAELSLKVTPEINPDGSVILEIEAKNDSRGANVTTGSGSAPAIDTKKAETTVLVKDGETTVIGGIFIMDKQESDAGVPLLKDVPVLGHLFKSKSVSEERRELLVFITPRILD
jgi:type IV pilus assembly protein PilQ